MYAVSPRFLAALRESHTVAVRATIYPPTGAPLEASVIEGQVRADRDARVRRQGSASVAFSLALDADALRVLAFGGYVKLERGVAYPDGTSELVPVGMMRVDSVSWDADEGAASFTLLDRHAQLQDEPFVTPWAPVGMKPSDAIRAAVEQVFGATIPYSILTTPATEPPLGEVVYDQDRAQAIGDLASSVGAAAFFDAAGGFVLRPMADPTTPPVWTVDAGATGVLEHADESLDRTTVRNGVAVRGQDVDSLPVYALAVDNDAASPTRWGGPFGKVALVTTLAGVTTQAQANSTAASLLNLRLGAARSVTMRALPNPALEPGDVVEVVFADARSERHVVNAVEVPLNPTAPVTLVTTSHFRPSVGAVDLRRAPPVRVYAGAAAWRELEDVGEVDLEAMSEAPA